MRTVLAYVLGITFLIDLASHGGTYYHIYKEKPMHKSIFAIQQPDILFLVVAKVFRSNNSRRVL